MSDEGRESQAIHAMRARFAGWLSAPDPSQLVRWLLGIGLPGDGDEAFLWLLRGLPTGRDYSQAATTLAEQLAPLVTREDIDTGHDPKELLLYNLLRLCESLQYPDQLGEPLLEVWRSGGVPGVWDRWTLNHLLRAALIRNQPDCDMELVWWDLLDGHTNEVLGGNRFDGFEGILRMPSKGRGEPDFENLGRAICTLADYLKPDVDRRLKFNDVIDRVELAYPSERVKFELFRQGWEKQWGWAWLEYCYRIFDPSWWQHLEHIAREIESDRLDRQDRFANLSPVRLYMAYNIFRGLTHAAPNRSYQQYAASQIPLVGASMGLTYAVQ